MKKSEAERLARMFGVLSVATRVRMLALLNERCLCVNALAGILEISPAAVSQHLRILRDVGAVIAEKRGYFVHYCVNMKVLEKWRDMTAQLLQNE